jgi:hypothetical protein
VIGVDSWMVAVARLLVTGGGIAALVGLGKLILDWRRLRSEAPGHAADAAQVISGTALALLTPLREEITAQAAHLSATQDELRHARAEAAATRAQLDALIARFAESETVRAELSATLTLRDRDVVELQRLLRQKGPSP